MNDYSKITSLYSRLSVGDEDRDGGESNSIQNQKKFLESYARQLKLTNIWHYIDDDESGRFFDRSAYSRMTEDMEIGKVGVCIMKDMTRWGRDFLQVGNAMEIFHRNNVRFIAVNGIYSQLFTESNNKSFLQWILKNFVSPRHYYTQHSICYISKQKCANICFFFFPIIRGINEDCVPIQIQGFKIKQI